MAGRRPALYLAVAAAGALMVNVITAGEPAAHAGAQPTSVSIAAQLGVAGAKTDAAPTNAVRPLEQLAASRDQRDAARNAAAQTQAAADAAAKAAAVEAARVAAEQAAAAQAAAAQAAAAQAAAVQAAAAKAQATAAAAAPSGSFQDYARSKVGSGQFSCLENLWGKESRWNPNAQNPGSTAYGIPQFLNSTWAGTGIAKTSDGYKQIDAGLIYINRAYGSPCNAWAHSQSTGWY
jgi:membrane protein involved in colicin uptake